MADYKEIKGITIRSVASDLNSPAAEGEVWFNTASGDYKTISLAAGAWATGGNLNTARRSGSVAVSYTHLTLPTILRV